jgi:D-glycerate 3-kinase
MVEFGAMLEALGLDAADSAAWRLRERAGSRLAFGAAPPEWQRLAAAIARRLTCRPSDPPGALPCWPGRIPGSAAVVLGLSGGQGSGKSTLARALVEALETAGARAVAMSLDDFYLSRAARAALAAEVHPLLRTRGVPGTHDVELLGGVLAALRVGVPVAVPAFDKGLDDRLPESSWRRIDGPVDAVILEGWCLGARPEPGAALDRPCNDLEAREDPLGTWRRYVDAALAGPYARVWEALDGLVLLRVPDMDAVLRWRTRQEQALPPERRMDAAALARFVAHYERITRATLREAPPRTSLIVDLADDHGVAAIRMGGPRPARPRPSRPR